MSHAGAASEIEVHGHCYCGAIEFRVRVPAGERPIFTAYCHCDSCRRAHAAPLYHVVCVDASWFELSSGAESLQEFRKPSSSIVRAFCRVCGSKVLNRFPAWSPGGKVPLAWFPNLLDEGTQHDLPAMFRPAKNNRLDEAVLDADMLRVVLDHG